MSPTRCCGSRPINHSIDEEDARCPHQEQLRIMQTCGRSSGCSPKATTRTLFLEGSDEKFLGRKAGQYASIRIMRPDGWSEPHPFTISCAPEDAQLRFTIKKIGKFTSAVPDLMPGTPVKCAGPLGVFCTDIDARPSIVMIAGGVGITPFLSVLRHFRNIGAGNEVKLFWSNKTIEDVICSDEISEMTKALRLRVIHNLSRDEDVKRHRRDSFPEVFYEPGRLGADVLGRHGIGRVRVLPLRTAAHDGLRAAGAVIAGSGP